MQEQVNQIKTKVEHVQIKNNLIQEFQKLDLQLANIGINDKATRTQVSQIMANLDKSSNLDTDLNEIKQITLLPPNEA